MYVEDRYPAGMYVAKLQTPTTVDVPLGSPADVNGRPVTVTAFVVVPVTFVIDIYHPINTRLPILT